MKAPVLFFLLMVWSSFVSGQNLSGIWKGNLSMGAGCFSQNNLEVQLHFNGDSVFGDCYQYDNINYYVKKSLTGRYDVVSRTLYLHERDVTTFHIPQHCSICVKNFRLDYRKDGRNETLTGEWDGKILGTNSDCSTGPIVLSRVKESAFKEVPEVLVDTGTLRLDFYDNAEVDGDSITVLVNKNVVISHQRLSTKPITIFVSIDLRHTFQEIEMVAENLGSIPPNTAMLIITAGTKKYQLFLSSTEEKNAMVRFVYDKRETPETQ